MEVMPIGVMTWVLSDPFKSVKLAQAVGVKTMQLGCPTDEYYTSEKKEELIRYLRKAEIKVTTVFCGYAGESYANRDIIFETVGFRNPKNREKRMKKTFQISDFAKDLEVTVIGAHVGFIPENRNDPLYNGMVKTVQQIADYCKENGQYFALETGQETATVLLRFIKDVGRDNIRVNFDPANMLAYNSGDPLEALETLRAYVIGVHCKDFMLPTKSGAEGREVPFGEGDIGAEKFIRKLKEIGYQGPLTIEREIQDMQKQKSEMIKIKKRLESIREKVLSLT